MSQIVDDLIAFKILQMLVTPFESSPAYQMGLIDKKGNALKKLKDMTTTEKDNYTALHRMIFRLQKILKKIPIVNSKLGTMATAVWLVKECQNGRSVARLEEDFIDTLRKIQQENLVLVDEYIIVEKFLKEDGMGAAAIPANKAGAGVSTDQPVVRKKTMKDYKMFNRKKPVNVGA